MSDLNVEVAGSGPALVLIHGLGATLFSWRHAVAGLGASYRTHNVDMLGFGASGTPTTYTLDEQATAIADYIEGEGLTEVTLAGHSMGGGVCLHLTQILPDRGITVERMVLAAPVCYPVDGSAFGFAAGPVAALGELVDFIDPAKPTRRLLEKGYYDDTKIEDAQVAAYKVNFDPVFTKLPLFIQHAVNLQHIRRIVKTYPSITVPTLLIWGDHDEVLPVGDYGKQLVKDLPDARLETIAQAGHIVHEEWPDKVGKLMAEFLG